MMPSKNQSLTGSNANENKFITQKKMNRREALRRAIDANMKKIASDKIDWKESQMLQAAIAASAAEDKKKVEMLATEKAVLLESSAWLKNLLRGSNQRWLTRCFSTSPSRFPMREMMMQSRRRQSLLRRTVLRCSHCTAPLFPIAPHRCSHCRHPKPGQHSQAAQLVSEGHRFFTGGTVACFSFFPADTLHSLGCIRT